MIKLVSKFISSPLVRRHLPVPNTITENESKLLVLPYIKDISEKFERICCPLNIKIYFQTATTLRKLLVHIKQATPMEKKKGVVYIMKLSSRLSSIS